MGRRGDAAADLWGLGACLYTAVEGRAPFDRGDMLASMTAVVADEPDLSRHAGSLQPVISGLLNKDPGKRLGPAEAERMLRQVASAGGRARWLRTRRRRAAGGTGRPQAPLPPAPASAPDVPAPHEIPALVVPEPQAPEPQAPELQASALPAPESRQPEPEAVAVPAIAPGPYVSRPLVPRPHGHWVRGTAGGLLKVHEQHRLLDQRAQRLAGLSQRPLRLHLGPGQRRHLPAHRPVRRTEVEPARIGLAVRPGAVSFG